MVLFFEDDEEEEGPNKKTDNDDDDTDNGLKYHPGKAECIPPKMKCAMSIVCEDIPTERLLDSSFWFMLFKQLVYPSDKNGPKEL